MCVYTCPGSLDLYNAKIGEFHVSRGPRRRYLYTRMEDRERDEVKAGSELVRSDPSIHRSNYYPLLHGSGILNSSIFFFFARNSEWRRNDKSCAFTIRPTFLVLRASFLNLMLSLSGALKIATAIKISIDARNLDYDKPFGFLATFRSRIHVEEEE